MSHDAGVARLERPFPGKAELQQGSQAIHLTEYDGRAAGALSRGHAESRLKDLTEPVVVFGLLRPHVSPGWGCSLLEDWCCWAVGAGDVGQCKPQLFVK